MPVRLLPILVGASLLLTATLTGCKSDTQKAAPGMVKALVVAKVMPVGKLVGAAAQDGTIKTVELKADLVPAEALQDIESVRCLVAARSIPQGTVLRRSQFIEPEKLGLPGGLTDGTSPVTPCR